MSNSNTATQRNATKGAVVRQMGFETSIHALPGEIKQEIDKMIGWKYSPIKILRQVAQKYPNQLLPSKSALYNYRKKYFTESLTNQRQISQADSKLDIDKIKLKSVLLGQIKRFIAFDLPSLRERWLIALERDENLVFPGTKDIGRLYMDAVKVGLDTIPKLNINLGNEVEDDSKDEKSEIDKQELIDHLLVKTINRRGYQMMMRLQREAKIQQSKS